MNRVAVNPNVIQWALDRSGLSVARLAARFPKLDAWRRGDAQPTLRQLEAFAKASHVPIGYLFLPSPPTERVPIPDLRTIAGHGVRRPSPDLLDMIHLCQQRQAWYRDFAREAGQSVCEFVGSAALSDSVPDTAARMRRALGMDMDQRRRSPTWTAALRRFIAQADDLGVLVMVSGVVGSNNRRKLDPEEFRGFACSDDLAPLVFVNGADTKAAQMFTLAHELAHLWLGASALSDVGPETLPRQQTERWCNEVAAELLVPMDVLRTAYQDDAGIDEATQRLARRFKVSTLVILRRLQDAGLLSREAFLSAYEDTQERLRSLSRRKGGDFYLTQAVRAGRRFARALIVSTFEGQSSFTEAFRLLGVRKVETLRRFGTELEVRL